MSSFIADIPVIQSTIQNILYEIFDYLYTKSKYLNFILYFHTIISKKLHQ